MPIEVLMPALSPTMTEGKLARWVKREGETVNSGDVIAEIETDKATMEVEAVDEGVLGKILVAEGSEHVAVNTPIAMILVEGEDAKALTAGTPAPAKAAAPAPAAPAAAPAAPPSPSPAAPAQAAGARIFASPLAKRMAAEAGLDLAAIKGSGPRGRIIKADIEAAKQAPPAAKPAAAPQAAKPAPAAAAAPQPFETPYVEVANSTMRKVIARRLSDSKRDIPHYYLTIECNIDPLLELRDKLNARTGEGPAAFKLSVNDFVIRAVALALRAYPDANCSWTDEAIRFYQTVDVAVAVAAPNGLITPIVRNADAKGLAAISNEIKHLAGRARESKLMPEEYVGGGFTVSNLGMYGIKEFAAIINPPQSCLLAVGAAEKRPIVKDGALAIGTMMSCTLSADHRSVDGAKGASFLKVFKGLIEDPLTMLL
ncbi:MAG TPA: pyruvate dehydrogenase complex dihydrolipoamide acetyltransferase [Defluviicoccus sp.]|nr:pyruvate dehydrogenase complex dihydrolipoamide acetyltransferase [Defluviicoccus sp.]